MAATQDGIIASHFGSATNPTQGQGFNRSLTRFPITPGFAVNVTLAELQALAADARVTRINYDRALPPSLIDSVPLIGMTAAYTLNATGAGQAVAVLDTGVKSNHEFLTGKVVAEACFSNAGGGGGQVTLCPRRGIQPDRRRRCQRRYRRLHQRLRATSASTAATSPASPQA